MEMTTHAQWSGLGFAPFSLPDLPFAGSDRKLSFVTEWSTGGCRDESRTAPRRSLQCEVYMTDRAFSENENPLPIRGECTNLSSDGLYAVVPLGYGLAIGQHYVFQLRDPQGGEETSPQLGTIVRTELLRRGGEDQLGIGVRLSIMDH